ncbi:MAG: hypothetical protein FJ313_06385, partial [Gemmatimonadetes bacterium]|nr:hypothetical protein [Gemmatimonadota bacterium]
MEIYKYLPRKPGSVIGDGTSQKYFSESAFASSLEASQYLSVPYEPAYRVKIDDLWLEPDEEGLWEVFAGSATRETRRRVWAAFGLHGGAWERVTSKQFLGETEMEHRREGYAGRWSVDCILPTGGFIGEYSSFLLPTEHDFLASLLTRFLRQHKSRGEAGEFGEFKEGFQWKVPDDLVGGIFYFKLG